MFEIGSPNCNTARNLLMSNVEIVHPQQPQDISSLKDSENEFEKQFKNSSSRKFMLRKKVRTKQTFFQLIKTQQQVVQFVRKIQKSTNFMSTFPKSINFDYLMRSVYKGNYAAKQYSYIILLKLQLKYFWEIYLYFLNLALIFFLPLNTHYISKLLLTTFVSFLLEMGTKFVKPFYKEGRLIRDKHIIIKTYLNFYFVFDVLRISALLSVILNIEQQDIIILSYFVLFLMSVLKLHLKFICDNYFLVKFLELICLILLTCHFFTNDIFYQNKELNYLDKFAEVLDFFMQKKEIYLPQGDNFTLIHILFELISALFKAYVLIEIINYCLLNQEQFRKKRELFNLQKHLSALKVSSLITNRVISYYKTIMKQDQKIKTQDFHTFFTQKLKPNLAQELKLQIQGNFLTNFKVFNKFTVQTLKKLICNMEDVEYTPNQVIYRQNVPDDQSIYFIFSGKVLLTFANTELQTLDEKSSFGQLSFFTGSPRSFSATSLGYTKLYKIPRAVYLSAVSQIPQDLETAQMIKDQIIFQHRFDVVGRKCVCCQEFTHLIQACPKLHYMPNKDILFSRLLYPVKMFRKRYVRQRKRYPNTLHCQFINHMAAQEYQENNNLLNEDDQSEHLLEAQLSSSSSLLEEFKMKSSYSPDPFSMKKRQIQESERGRQAVIHTIQEYSDEIQSFSSSDLGLPEIKDEPQIRIIQQQIKPKGDLLKSQNSGSGKPIQPRYRSSSQNALDLSLIPPATKKVTMRSLSQLSLEEKTLQRQKSKRTNTSQQNIQSLMQLFQNDLNPILVDFIPIDIDRAYNFRTYLPNNNLQIVLKQLKQVHQVSRSYYTLNYELSKKLRKILNL